MKLYCYDLGTFYLKKYEFLIGKDVIYEQDHIQIEINPESSHKQVIDLIKKDQHCWDDETKVAIILPDNFSTTRYFTLPVKSKKKVLQILPFKLEDSLPFSRNNILYNHSIYVEKKTSNVIVNIINKEEFQDLFNSLNKFNILPDFITTNIGALSSLSGEEAKLGKIITPQSKSFCLLDLGHSSTKGYFFHEDYESKLKN